jgi:hypothetical protein
MRRCVVIALAVAAACSDGTSEPVLNDLTGRWVGTTDGGQVGYVFEVGFVITENSEGRIAGTGTWVVPSDGCEDLPFGCGGTDVTHSVVVTGKHLYPSEQDPPEVRREIVNLLWAIAHPIGSDTMYISFTGRQVRDENRMHGTLSPSHWGDTLSLYRQ